MTVLWLTGATRARSLQAAVVVLPIWRKSRRMAFWHLSPRRLVVAVIEPTAAEPLLHTCASSCADLSPQGSCFSAGLLETARAAGALELPQVAYLGEPVCRLLASTDAAAQGAVAFNEGQGETEGPLRVALRDDPQALVLVEPAALTETAALFTAARLRLVWLDCAGCALASLAEFLGCEPADGTGAGERSARLDPLAAVSVHPRCEDLAVALGDELAVPVGGALERFGTASDGIG